MKLTPYLLFLPAILTCCGVDEIAPPQTEADVEAKQIVLGDKLPNPYSLSVMQRAADELAESATHGLAVSLGSSRAKCTRNNFTTITSIITVNTLA